MEIILLILLLILGITAAIVLLKRGIVEKQSDFIVEKSKAIQRLSEEKNSYITSTFSELQSQIASLEIQKQNLQDKIRELKENYEQSKQTFEEQIQNLQTLLSQELHAVSTEGVQKVEALKAQYKLQEQEIAAKFEAYSEEINLKRQQIQEELDRAEAKQLEIIEQFKRSEKIKENKNYYRIVLSDDDTEDVKKLRKYADELHNPQALYKLIYKEYYERPFGEMVGRVANGRGCGIYKITNLENGRCYIGQTRQTFKERWRTHLKRGVKAEPGTQNKLYGAMWQDGAENFTFEVLSECQPEELNTKEKEFIAFYHADTWGYNGNKGISD